MFKLKILLYFIVYNYCVYLHVRIIIKSIHLKPDLELNKDILGSINQHNF